MSKRTFERVMEDGWMATNVSPTSERTIEAGFRRVGAQVFKAESIIHCKTSFCCQCQCLDSHEPWLGISYRLLLAMPLVRLKSLHSYWF